MGMGKPSLIFIFLFVSTTITAITEEQGKFLEELNRARQMHANAYNLPNMHMLVWNEDLLGILNTLNFNGEWPYSRITWRFTELAYYDGVTQIIDDEMNTFLSEPDKEAVLKKGTIDRLELLNPFQTVIACGSIPDGDADERKLVCLVGPEGQGKLWDVDNKSSETAGSKCPHHYHNENGLCVPDDSSEISLFGFQGDFLVEVNELRREYAKQYNVSNMHQLTWNDELVKIIDPIDWFGEWPFSRRMWRFCALVSYEKQDVIIRKELDDFIRKSAEEKKEALAYMNRWNMGAMEVLNPRQSEIGCVRKWTGPHTMSIVCLVGTSGRAELWDFETNSKEEPGSACPQNFKNQDGLCVPAPVSIYGDQEDFLNELNNARKKYAKQFNISNMHQLVWSHDLVKINEPLNWVGPWPSARITWRFTRIWSYRNIMEGIDDLMESFLKKTKEEQTSWLESEQAGNADLLELLNPHQTVIGCAEKTEVVTILVCLIGSEGALSLFDTTNKSPSISGSSCSNHYKYEEGLCVPVSTTYVSYFGFWQDFLKGVNELRRNIAKQNQIPNMHELSWHQEFVDIAQSDSWPSDHLSWRYTKIKSYRDLKTIEDEVKAFLGKTEDEKKIFITENESLNGLELMNPEQTLIGCGKRKGDYNELTCLIGMQGLWPEITFDSNAPGSKCLKDFVNTDGLCTLLLPTPPPPQKAIPQGGATQGVERVTQRTPGVVAPQSEKDEPDTATTGFSPYLIISLFIVLFLY